VDGGKPSPMKDNTSSTSITRKLLMSMETRTSKETRLLYGEDTMVLTKDGLLSTLTRLLRNQLLDTAENGVCTSTDCSTSDQDSQ
jgi:hypothetical protein